MVYQQPANNNLSPVGYSYWYPELLGLGGGVGDVTGLLPVLNYEIFLVSQAPLRHSASGP